MTSIIIHGEEMKLNTISLNIVVNSTIVSVTVSGIQDLDGEAGEPIFAHTHVVQFQGGNPPSMDSLVTAASEAFKEALEAQGGIITSNEEEEPDE
ncbi:hypothetical protein [Lysinibacter cavernae]|uniref:hypothetical protein n=1 Tax=Lysinibacter cavernae TaxID=1640652 RepID=UPI0036076C2C